MLPGQGTVQAPSTRGQPASVVDWIARNGSEDRDNWVCALTVLFATRNKR
jgi:hypothetical protein